MLDARGTARWRFDDKYAEVYAITRSREGAGGASCRRAGELSLVGMPKDMPMAITPSIANTESTTEGNRGQRGRVPAVRDLEGSLRSAAIRPATLIFMAATAQAQAEATKAAQHASIEHAKQYADRA
jgi:hypothetical protein